jgi:DNA-binding LacI/PurR family transcriptional regulator
VVESPERSECHLVAIDNVSAGRRVAKHLLERGYRKIGFMMNGTVLRSNVNWRNRLFGVAGEMALREIEYAVRPLDFKPGCQLDLKKLYRSDFQPDAIVCGNDETAVQLMKSLLAIGKRIPEDVAVVGFDDADIASSFKIPLTTVRQPSKLIAKSVLTTLLARIAHPANNPREILVSAPLVIRMSS